MDTVSKPGVASKHYADSAALANAGSGGSADSTKFATLFRLDTVKANRLTLWRYYSDTTNSRTYSNALYQAKGTYLVASDTTGKWSLINTKLDKTVYGTDTANARTYSNNLYQTKGTYLIASDSNNIRIYTNAQLALKLNSADTANRWVQVGQYYSDTTNGRTYSDNRYQPKMANGTNGYVWKMTSETTQGWSADISGGGGIDTTSLSNRIDSKISIADSNTKYVTAITFKDSIDNFQRAGTYLVATDTLNKWVQKGQYASDTTGQAAYRTNLLALKLNRTDTMTLSVRIDKKADTSAVVMPWELGAYAPLSHTQAQSTITNLADSLLAKAQRTHGHLFSGITGAQDSLQQVRTLVNGKQAAGTYLIPTDSNNIRTYTNSQLALKLNYADTSGRWTHVTKYGVDTTGQRTYTTNLLALKLPYTDTTSSLARQWRLGAYKTISSFATDTSNQRTYTNSQLALKLPYSDTTSSLARQWRLGAYKTISSFATDTANQRTYTNNQLGLKLNVTDTSTILGKKNTATAGSYTNANITIRNDGVITSISNGSGGSGGSAYSPWTNYGFTRLSDTLVSVAHNVDFKAGKPIRFRDVDSVYRYALITQVKTGVTNDTLIVSGPSFYSVADSLWLGSAEKVIKTDFGLNEYWNNYPNGTNAPDSIIYLHTGAEFIWGNSTAFMVQWGHKSRTADGSSCKITPWKNAEALIGIKGQPNTASWSYSSAYYVNTSNYQISYGDYIDIRAENGDSTPDARNLTLSFWFVLE
ncbi:MAG: hypothetical protein WC549_02150 [Actinomycetota bacterium]